MAYKICRECNLNLPEESFNFKQAPRRDTICKVCEYTKKKKYTCELPPNTKQCKCCKEIRNTSLFRTNSLTCFICVENNKPIKEPKERANQKQCKNCKEVFSIDNFYTKGIVNGQNAYQCTCKQCSNKIRYERKRNRPTERSLIVNELRSKNANYEKLRANNYGISEETLKEMITTQNNKCYICGKDGEHNTNKKLAIDHCHSTNKVRKLLCNHCNSTLGMTRENLSYINKLIDYIKEHS